MPLFRFHRGSLDDSLSTTIIVANLAALRVAIARSNDGFVNKNNDFVVKIAPYPAEDQCFDPRTGWFTQIVTANLFSKDEFGVVGFLSEPLKPIVLHIKNGLLLTLNETPPDEDGSKTIYVEQRNGDLLSIRKGAPFVIELATKDDSQNG